MIGHSKRRIGSLIERMKSSSLIRNLAAVTSSAALAQAIVFAFSPLITRIYGPEAFGAQGVFLSLISILTPAIALRYPMAIVTAQRDTEAQYLARISLQIAAALAVFLFLILLLFHGPISGLLGADILGYLILFLPVALFCVALQDVTTYQAARLNQFGLVAKVTIIQAFVINAARVLGGLLAPIAATLIAITAVVPSLQALQLWRRTKDKLPRASRSRARQTRAILRKHREFPLYRVPTDVLNAASQSAPVILLASLFSPAAAGLYALTRSVFNLPLNIISTAMSNVLYARFAELARERRPITPLLIKMTFFLLLPAPIIVGVSYFAPTIFAFMFGEEWREAGHYAQWMSIWIVFGIANLPAIRIAPIIQRQQQLFVANILMLVVRVLAILAGYYYYRDARTAVILFSLVSAASNVAIILDFILPTRKFDRANCEMKP